MQVTSNMIEYIVTTVHWLVGRCRHTWNHKSQDDYQHVSEHVLLTNVFQMPLHLVLTAPDLAPSARWPAPDLWPLLSLATRQIWSGPMMTHPCTPGRSSVLLVSVWLVAWLAEEIIQSVHSQNNSLSVAFLTLQWSFRTINMNHISK